MNTFLPFPSFTKSAHVLDWRRLGKQRVEAWQIRNVLTKGHGGWRNHPAVLMWAGHEEALSAYTDAMIREWVRRGYRNTMTLSEVKHYQPPPWLGRRAFHRSHRSNLLRKDLTHYARYFPNDTPDLPYVWPVQRSS